MRTINKQTVKIEMTKKKRTPKWEETENYNVSFFFEIRWTNFYSVLILWFVIFVISLALFSVFCCCCWCALWSIYSRMKRKRATNMETSTGNGQLTESNKRAFFSLHKHTNRTMFNECVALIGRCVVKMMFVRESPVAAIIFRISHPKVTKARIFQTTLSAAIHLD